ncbi:MAG: hypothetical protein AMS25_06555 [Gemmatimonas sp. SM23_52]|nr:MAG: hypothetical protein AMS25_06555 [Gemmatimonas sp. SM23_52]
MIRTKLEKTALLLILVLARPAAAQEQAAITVMPFVGLYLPTADLVSDQIVPEPAPLQIETINMEQRTGLALGLRAGRSLSNRVYVELEILYASSEIKLSGTRREPADQPTSTLSARVLGLGANALLEVFRAPFTPFAIHLLGGLGLVSRGGEFFNEGGGVGDAFFGSLDGGTALALILGTGFRYGLSPKTSIRLDLRDYISSYAQSLPGGQLDAELQNDFWVSGGVELTL